MPADILLGKQVLENLGEFLIYIIGVLWWICFMGLHTAIREHGLNVLLKNVM